MKDKIIWIVSIVAFGVLGATARYLHSLGQKNDGFSFKKWAISVFIGCTLSVVAGMVCKNFNLSEELTYAVVAIVAISGKELISIIPDIAKKYLEKKAKTLGD